MWIKQFIGQIRIDLITKFGRYVDIYLWIKQHLPPSNQLTTKYINIYTYKYINYTNRHIINVIKLLYKSFWLCQVFIRSFSLRYCFSIRTTQRWLKYYEWPSIIQTWPQYKEGIPHTEYRKHDLCTFFSATN
jgi:hypothetical protein